MKSYNAAICAGAGLLMGALLLLTAISNPASGQRTTGDQQEMNTTTDVSLDVSIYRKTLEGVQLRDGVTYKGLTVFPLTGRNFVRDYLMLDAAIAQNVVTINDTGRVEDVEIVNSGNKPVLIVDGEQILGAKQNRVFTSTFLVPPKKTLIAKVSCVEQGRWSASTESFSVAGTQLFARARQMNTAAVADNLAMSSSHKSDQGRVWEHVASRNMAAEVAAPTQAMQDAYQARSGDIQEYVDHFKPRKGQIGAVFAIRDEIIGMDIFDSDETLTEMYPKLIKSYALDVITTPVLRSDKKPEPATMDQAKGFLASAINTSGKSYESQGLGRDLRLEGWKVQGAALIAFERVVHTAVFSEEKRDTQASSLMRERPESSSERDIRPLNRPQGR